MTWECTGLRRRVGIHVLAALFHGPPRSYWMLKVHWALTGLKLLPLVVAPRLPPSSSWAWLWCFEKTIAPSGHLIALRTAWTPFRRHLVIPHRKRMQSISWES